MEQFSFERRAEIEAPPRDEMLAGVTWGLRDIVIGTVAVLVLFFILGAAIIFPVVESYGENSPEALLATALTVVLWDIGMVLIVYWRVRRHGAGWRELGFRAPKKGGVGRLLGTIALGYLVAISAVIVYGVLIDLLGLEDLLPGQQIDEEFYEHRQALLVLGLAVVLFAPIAEEVFFRGFLFAGLGRMAPVIVAALLSSVVFAMAHADLGLIIPFTVVGLVLAYTYRNSGSLLAPIGVHFVFNFLSFVVLVFVPDAR